MTSHHPITVINRSSSTGAGELETFAMANCLMLLNNKSSTTLTRGGTTEDESKWFPCKTCGRKFPSFQALGGHRASHNKIKSSLLLLSNEGTQFLKSCSPSEKPSTHVCTVCGDEFPTGQALGGHMRRHSKKTQVSGGESSVTTGNSEISGGDEYNKKKRKLDEEVIVLVRNLKRSSSGKRVCLDNLDLDLDLNLYLWNDKCDENYGVEDKDFLKLQLRQPSN